MRAKSSADAASIVDAQRAPRSGEEWTQWPTNQSFGRANW